MQSSLGVCSQKVVKKVFFYSFSFDFGHQKHEKNEKCPKRVKKIHFSETPKSHYYENEKRFMIFTFLTNWKKLIFLIYEGLVSPMT